MSEDDLKALVVALVDRLQEQADLLGAQQAILIAVLDYVREQPGFDRSRFDELHAAAVAHRPAPPSESLESWLRAWLRDYEGPVH